MTASVPAMPETRQPPRQRNYLLFLMLSGLYLVQGIPVGLAFQAFPALMRNAGASLELVALVPAAALPWVLKCVWAPWVENHWSSRLGRRRSWLIPLQLLCAFTLVVMALMPLNSNAAGPMLVVIGLLALFSSTQDIATDGLATEQLRGARLGQANTLQVGCFMLGMLLGGPLVMIGVDQVGHQATFALLAGIELLCLLPVLRWQEPAPCSLQVAQPARLKHFFQRPHVVSMLALCMCATMGGAVLFSLSKLVLLDAGWSMTDVGVISGAGNSLMVILGCMLALPLISRLHAWSVLLYGLALLVVASLGWLFLVLQPGLPVDVVWVVALFTGLAIGINSVASYTLVMSFAREGEQPGTDVAGFQASQALGDTLMAMLGVAVASWLGYSTAVLLAIPVALCCVALVAVNRQRMF